MNAFDRFEREFARLETNAQCTDSEALYGPEPDDDENEEEETDEPDTL